MFKWLLAVFMMVAAIVAADVWWSSNHAAFDLEVSPGDSAKDICQKLNVQDVNYFSDVCYVLMKLQRSEQRLHVGRWTISENQSLWQVVNQLLNQPAKMAKVTLIEGMPIKAIVAQLSKQKNILMPLELQQELQQHSKKYEGIYYPDTYQLADGGDVSKVLRLAEQRMQKLLRDEWASRHPDALVKTPEEALIVASLIEEETRYDDEKPLIASVIYNRMNKNMRLQIDASVHYALNKYTSLSLKDLKIKHPYNTYYIKGLPPSPIALVTPSSLNAALQPASTDYIFYVADPKTGKHIFNKRYEDHLGSIKKIRSAR